MLLRQGVCWKDPGASFSPEVCFIRQLLSNWTAEPRKGNFYISGLRHQIFFSQADPVQASTLVHNFCWLHPHPQRSLPQSRWKFSPTSSKCSPASRSSWRILQAISVLFCLYLCFFPVFFLHRVLLGSMLCSPPVRTAFFPLLNIWLWVWNPPLSPYGPPCHLGFYRLTCQVTALDSRRTGSRLGGQVGVPYSVDENYERRNYGGKYYGKKYVNFFFIFLGGGTMGKFEFSEKMVVIFFTWNKDFLRMKLRRNKDFKENSSSKLQEMVKMDFLWCFLW